MISSGSARIGYLYVVSAAVIWGVSGSAAKFLFQSGISSVQLVQLRITIAAGALLGYLLIRNPGALKIAPRDILYFMILGAAAMSALQFTYLYAISKINVAAAILLQYSAPGFIALHAAVFAGEKPRALTLVAIAGAAAGCYLAVGAHDLNLLRMNLSGILAGVAAGLSFAWYSIQGEYGMRRYPPWTVLFYAVFFAAVVWNLLHPPFEAFGGSYSPVQWGWILYVAVMGTLVPFGLYFRAIDLIRSTPASITATLEPITAGIVSYLFLGETLSPLQVFGGVLVIGSVVLIQIGPPCDPLRPGEIRKGRRDGPCC